MIAKEVAAELMKTPDAQVLLRVGGDWVETCGVKATGQHRNAVTLATSPAAAINEGQILDAIESAAAIDDDELLGPVKSKLD